MFRRIIFLCIALAIAGVGGIWLTTTSSDNASEEVVVVSGDVEISGVIDAVHDERPSDGSLTVLVDGKMIVLEHGGLEPPGSPPEIRGEVSGPVKKGQRVDARVRPFGTSFTVYGDSGLYFRAK